MNGEELYALLGELPDAWITEEPAPHRSRRISLRAVIPAIAACIAVIIAAAVYPKLRQQKPDVPADSAVVATQSVQTTVSESVNETTVTASAALTTVPTETAAQTASRTTESVTQTVTTQQPPTETAAPQDAVSPVQPDTTASAVPAQSTDSGEQQQETVPVQTDSTAASSSGEPETQNEAATEPVSTGVTSLISENVTEPDTPVTERRPQTISIPLLHLKTGMETLESPTPPNSTEGSFYLIHAAEGVQKSDRETLADFDFDTQDCLMYTLRTNCADAKVTEAEMQDTALTVHVTCTDAAEYQEPRYLRFALGIPKSLGTAPYQCSAVYSHAPKHFHNDHRDTKESETETITLTIH